MTDKNCSKCGAVCDSSAAFCGHCGHKFSQPRNCSRCGSVVNLGQSFCTQCGTEVAEKDDLGASFEAGYKKGQEILYKIFPRLEEISAVSRSSYWGSFVLALIISVVLTFIAVIVLSEVISASVFVKIIAWVLSNYIFIMFFGHAAYGRILDAFGPENYERKKSQINIAGAAVITLGFFGAVGTFIASLGSLVLLVFLGALPSKPRPPADLPVVRP